MIMGTTVKSKENGENMRSVNITVQMAKAVDSSIVTVECSDEFS